MGNDGYKREKKLRMVQRKMIRWIAGMGRREGIGEGRVREARKEEGNETNSESEEENI